MLADAIKARIPLIAVATDDVVNAEDVLQSIATGKPAHWDDIGTASPIAARVYWTTDDTHATIKNYRRLQKANASLVFINGKPNPLIFDAGILPVPEEMLHEYLSPFTKAEQRQVLLRILKGVSLKAANEIVGLTIARTGGLNPSEVRRTRLMLTGGVQGLIPLETEVDTFYVWPPELQDWLTTNQKFFESTTTPHKLVPRGLLLAGPPGVGKSMAARMVAHKLKIPLYRLDISQALDKYIGVSENRVARALALAEQEAPCVILLDEVEKIFTHSDESGTVTRILSTLLWWLSEHRSRVITIMTTNDGSKIPPELYRPGRLDMALELPKLGLKEAKQFCLDVFKDIAGTAPTMQIQHKLREAIEATGKAELAHAEVSEIVFEAIKKSDWLTL